MTEQGTTVTGLTPEEDAALLSMLTQLLSVEEGVEPFVGYIRLQGGSQNPSRARKLATPIQVTGNPRTIMSQIKQRMAIARQNAGGTDIQIEAVPRGETHAQAGVTVAGEGGTRGRDVDTDREETASETAIRVMSANNNWLISKLIETVEAGRHSAIEAAAFMMKVEMIEKYAGIHSVGEAMKVFAPALEESLPEAVKGFVRIKLAQIREEMDGDEPDESDADATPIDKVRNAMTRVERAVENLQAEAAGFATTKGITPDAVNDLQAEIKERAKPILAMFGVRVK